MVGMRALWKHIYGDQSGIVALFSGERTELGSSRLTKCQSTFFQYPPQIDNAERFCLRRSSEGCEVYSCAHLLDHPRRIKANAAPLLALYADGDGARVRDGMPEPTAVVRSSPGREQFYWGLTSLVPPQEAEHLNRRLAYMMGADESGWDLTQLLRVPGTRNRKYVGAPPVKVVTIREKRYDPEELCAMVPPLSGEIPPTADCSRKPRHLIQDVDLSRLSARMRDLILHGNRREYLSRSEADFAVCVAMFRAGYSEAKVWAVMTDPANGISEKAFEKGRNGERYLALTIGKARALAGPPRMKRRGSIRVGAPRVGAGILGKVVIDLG